MSRGLRYELRFKSVDIRIFFEIQLQRSRRKPQQNFARLSPSSRRGLPEMVSWGGIRGCAGSHHLVPHGGILSFEARPKTAAGSIHPSIRELTQLSKKGPGITAFLEQIAGQILLASQLREHSATIRCLQSRPLESDEMPLMYLDGRLYPILI